MAQAGKIDQYTADHLLEQLYPTGGDQTPERVRTPEIVQVKSYHQTPSPASGSIEKCRSSSTNTASTDNSNVDHNDVSGGLTNAGMISPNFSKGRKSNNPFYALSVAARAPATSAESSSVLDRSFPQDEKNSRDDGDFAWNPYSEGYRSVTPNLATPRPNEQLRSASVERREFAAPPRSDDGQARPRTPSRDALSYVEAPSPSSYLSPTIQNPALSGSPKRLRTSLQRLSSNQDPPPESPPPSSSQAHLQQQRMEADQAAKMSQTETETDTVGNTSPAVKEMPSNADAQAIMGPLQDLLAKERDIRELLKTRRDPIPRLPASELAYSQTPRSSHSTLPTPPPPPPQSQSQQQQQQMGVDQPSDSGQIWGRTVDSTDELLRCLLVSDEPDTVAVDNTLPTGYNVSPAAKENVRKRDVFKRFLPTSKKDRDPKW
ncbi:hypothetical protein BKA70DRAFT_1278503 [Coprinopsis sp. MPI-PUGE-AT-0042]|nr:hypothetical protein BKA70DRAFT_1278503 [Coprinopsis sp. MPI-PUGE-AT-0042]